MAESLSLTAPIALIKVNGNVVGRMKNITVTETFRRVTVYGLGEATPQELPMTQWSGTCTAGFYEISYDESGIPGATNRRTDSIRQFIDNIVLDNKGVDIVLLKRIEDSVDPNGLRVGKWIEHLTVKGAFMERESIDLSEGQVAGRNQDFTYKTPILISGVGG